MMRYPLAMRFHFFFFNDTATTEIYTLSLHDALPISLTSKAIESPDHLLPTDAPGLSPSRALLQHSFHCLGWGDRKSTRLNSSHGYISYAVFCLKKKRKLQRIRNSDSTDKYGLFNLAD